MSALFDSINEELNTTLTANGAITNKSSLNSAVDFFFYIGGMRNSPVPSIIEKFNNVYNDNRKYAMKLLFWCRDIRGGIGERRIFRLISKNLIEKKCKSFLKNLDLIKEYGRYDDLLYLYENISGDDKWTVSVVKKIESIFYNDLVIENNGLAAKWLPRQGKIANKLRKAFLSIEKKKKSKKTQNDFTTPKAFRQFLVKRTNVVEQKMCKKDWDRIDFSSVPSIAMSRYKNSFSRHSANFTCYLEDLENNKTKINAEALNPCDIIKSLNNSDSDEDIKLCNLQWKNLPDYIENDVSFLPVIDVSGSMETKISKSLTAMDVAISLGIYTAQRNKSIFNNHFITFSETPKLVKLSGNNLYEISSNLRNSDWGYNTNINAVFSLILMAAKKHKLKNSDLPTHIIIFSDMEFDSNRYDESTQKSIEIEYAKYNYKMPNIIYWNIASQSGKNCPVKYNKANVALVGGFSPSLMKSILSSKELTPISIMEKTILSKRYEKVTV